MCMFTHFLFFFFFNDTATTEIYSYFHTLSLHDALPISSGFVDHGEAGHNRRDWHCRAKAETLGHLDALVQRRYLAEQGKALGKDNFVRSEEHTSELQSLMRISYAVFSLKKKTKKTNKHDINTHK